MIICDLYKREVMQKPCPWRHLQPAPSNDECWDTRKVIVKRAITKSTIYLVLSKSAREFRTWHYLEDWSACKLQSITLSIQIMLMVNVVLDMITNQKMPEMSHFTQTITIPEGSIYVSLSAVLRIYASHISMMAWIVTFVKIESLKKLMGRIVLLCPSLQVSKQSGKPLLSLLPFVQQASKE